MFKIHINDGTKEMPTDDIFYVIAKEGIFLKKKLGVMESLAPVQNISILESVAKSARMHIPPLPARSFAKVIDFENIEVKQLFYYSIMKKLKNINFIPHNRKLLMLELIMNER